MGLGTERGEWEDYEWFDLRAERAADDEDAFAAVDLGALEGGSIWLSPRTTRVLLVDLDNLRAEPARLRTRVALAVELARQADIAVFAGQQASVDRARPALKEYADTALAVGGARNAADLALLDAVPDDDADVQYVVFSNDGIFARLAMSGTLTVVSPGAGALSDRLAEAAERVVDLQLLESVFV